MTQRAEIKIMERGGIIAQEALAFAGSLGVAPEVRINNVSIYPKDREEYDELRESAAEIGGVWMFDKNGPTYLLPNVEDHLGGTSLVRVRKPKPKLDDVADVLADALIGCADLWLPDGNGDVDYEAVRAHFPDTPDREKEDHLGGPYRITKITDINQRVALYFKSELMSRRYSYRRP